MPKQDTEMKGIVLDEITFNANAVAEEEVGGRMYDVIDITAAVGDIFYQDTFVSKETLKNIAQGWNGTVHDLSHLGTACPNGAMGFRENLDYVVGFNADSHWDDKTNSVRMKTYIAHDAPKYSTWKNYVDICRMTNRKPNVSMDVTPAKFKAMDIKDIPAGVVVPHQYVRNGKVKALESGVPQAVATCLAGKCNDKDGCGIDAAFFENCDSGNCDIEQIEIKRRKHFFPLTNEKMIKNE